MTGKEREFEMTMRNDFGWQVSVLTLRRIQVFIQFYYTRTIL